MKNYYLDPFDVIVFPVIDWHYRFQRPQHISTQLALHGHRVFYLRTYFLEGTQSTCKPFQNGIPIMDIQLGLLEYKNIVSDQLDEASKRNFLEQIAILRDELSISKAICLMYLPFWAPLVLDLRELYGWKIVYDAIDQLSGFSNVTSHMLEPEDEITRNSDLVFATSHLLFNEKSRLNPNCLLVPNGAEFDHFNYSPENVPEELIGIRKPIIGYYGAMSDWLDTELIHQLASARPDWSFILIGRIESADISPIRDLGNVYLLGEKPYELLPGYLQHFDTCIIPFKKIPLTEATNPVKLFEFLSAGKSVVATDLDELRHYREYVRLASSPQEWLEAIELALKNYQFAEVERRMSFARQNTWDKRILVIEDAIQGIYQEQSYASAPLPAGLQRENIVSSRLLTSHEGLDYWYVIYENEDCIYKQASFDLAEQEARFLAEFESEHFPRPLAVQSTEEYSIISFPKMRGQKLSDAVTYISASVTEFHNFIQHCLMILVELKEKGIIHRNICRENIWVQDGKPVLLDFAWAVSEQSLYFAPAGLGGYERPPDGSFSDVYSMGKILEYVNGRRYRVFDQVISLMTIRATSLRVADIDTLKLLFHAALKIALQDDIDSERVDQSLVQLLEQIAKRDQKIAWVNSEKAAAIEKKNRVLAEKDYALAEKNQIIEETRANLRFTEGQLDQILTSRAWKFTAWIQQVRLILIPLESRRARVVDRVLRGISHPFRKTEKN